MSVESGAGDLDAWIGKQTVIDSEIACGELNKLAATLDREGADFCVGTALPPLGHWLFFQRPALHSQLDVDGHARRGEFLPPVTLPRRMWAGSRIEFNAPLASGKPAQQQSEITAINSKQGKSGPLVFVTVTHQINQFDSVCLTEQQDIVYREVRAAEPGARGRVEHRAEQRVEDSPEHSADYSRTVTADPALLFRYSALTFNAHRIHYDRDYARDVEQYPGLVVQGPLLATMLLDLWQQNTAADTLGSFEFRALVPVFDLTPFRLCGREPDTDGRSALWVENDAGEICLQAEARIKP